MAKGTSPLTLIEIPSYKNNEKKKTMKKKRENLSNERLEYLN